MLSFLQKLTFKKILNILKVHLGYCLSSILKKEFSFGFPLNISVEPANVCNLHCPECPTGIGNSHGVKGLTDFQLFKKSVDELSPYLSSLILYFQGEPYLNKQFCEIIEYASVKKNIYTISSTNGHFLDKETSRKTVSSGLDKLIVSIDGATQDIYEKYRVGGSLAKVIDGINNIVEAKAMLKSSLPKIVISFLVTGENEHQIPEMRKLAKDLKVDKLVLKSAQIYDFENGSKLIPSIKKFSRYKKNINGTWSIKSKLNNKCKRLWESAVITNAGDVLPCCFDKSADYKFGNIKSNSFNNIKKEKEYSNFRKNILLNRKAISMCRNCTEGLKL
jgi:radical SAM protein with 4Fe4S-binding SPASM domain